MGAAIKHPVPDHELSPYMQIFNIRAL